MSTYTAFTREQIEAALPGGVWLEGSDAGSEIVVERWVNKQWVFRCYTGISKFQRISRAPGEDAIRFVLIDAVSGKPAGKTVRVHRTGTVESLRRRFAERVAELEAVAAREQPLRCKRCGAATAERVNKGSGRTFRGCVQWKECQAKKGANDVDGIQVPDSNERSLHVGTVRRSEVVDGGHAARPTPVVGVGEPTTADGNKEVSVRGDGAPNRAHVGTTLVGRDVSDGGRTTGVPHLRGDGLAAALASAPKRHQPTEEQAAILDAAREHPVLVIQAGAGTGKTATDVMLAEALPGRGVYTTFVRALVDDGRSKFPASCRVAGIHQLAFAAEGKRFAHRLNSGRVKAEEVAKLLGLPELLLDGLKRLAPGFLASQVMGAVRRFCQSDDREVEAKHFSRLDALDTGEGGRKTYANNDALRGHCLPFARRAWVDLTDPNGRLPFSHDCQPAGTLVRVLTRWGGANRHNGTSWKTEWTDIPIEDVREGDRVVTWSNETNRGKKRLGAIRKTGSPVIRVGSFHHRGELITVRTPTGSQSSYTPWHICIVRVGSKLRGRWVVYLMRKDGHYRAGRVQWAYGSQGNTLGITTRARDQGADAVWILSIHDSDSEAALAEALAQHRFNIPGWQFVSRNEQMPLDLFWAEVGDNQPAAEACLRAHGRSVQYPFLEPSEDNPRWDQQPVAMRACNLLDGMLVCEADGAQIQGKNYHSTGGWTNAWQPITISRTHHTGEVYSLEVEKDHTYVADGIVTHNCYVKIWELNHPVISCDYLLVDECQDLSPVMCSIIRKQQGVKLILVGDSAQQIFEWRGAVDALKAFPDAPTLYLSQCQPTGTMVRVPYEPSRAGTRNGGRPKMQWQEVPIENLVVGDLVVSWNPGGNSRGAVSSLVSRGRRITDISIRHYAGPLVVAKVGEHTSRYAPNHECVVVLGTELNEGGHVVYMMQKGRQFRIGRCPWQYGNGNGPIRRAVREQADNIWVLSVHDTSEGSALAEALAQVQSGIPGAGWRESGHYRMNLEQFWEEIGDNSELAEQCLSGYGLLIEYPLWSRSAKPGAGWGTKVVTAAANIRSGMKMLLPESSGKSNGSKGGFIPWSSWTPIEVSTEEYVGSIYSLSVDIDHTYIADGIVTHNSFRFGEAIADVANSVLATLAEPTALRLKGLPSIESKVITQGVRDESRRNSEGDSGNHCSDSSAARKDHRSELQIATDSGQSVGIDRSASDGRESRLAILCRTNAAAVASLLGGIAEGKRPFLVGGGADVIAFVEAAKALKEGRGTSHPELACFGSWAEVEEYSKLEDGADLALMVKLIKEFGCRAILDALRSMPQEKYADLVISTAHKAKGREWDHVRLAADFPVLSKCGDAEKKLVYVAVTRAKLTLDLSGCPFFTGQDSLDVSKPTPAGRASEPPPLGTRLDNRSEKSPSNQDRSGASCEGASVNGNAKSTPESFSKKGTNDEREQNGSQSGTGRSAKTDEDSERGRQVDRNRAGLHGRDNELPPSSGAQAAVGGVDPASRQAVSADQEKTEAVDNGGHNGSGQESRSSQQAASLFQATFSWTKFRDAWHVRGPKGRKPGEAVTVIKKNGRTSRERLGAVAWENEEAAIYRLLPK